MAELNNHAEREHALLSASSAHRWLECPASAVAAEAYPNEGTEFTREGTLAHEVAEVMARETGKGLRPDMMNYVWPEGVDQEMVDCAGGYADYIQEQITSDAPVVLLE